MLVGCQTAVKPSGTFLGDYPHSLPEVPTNLVQELLPELQLLKLPDSQRVHDMRFMYRQIVGEVMRVSGEVLLLSEQLVVLWLPSHILKTLIPTEQVQMLFLIVGRSEERRVG